MKTTPASVAATGQGRVLGEEAVTRMEGGAARPHRGTHYRVDVQVGRASRQGLVRQRTWRASRSGSV